VSRAVTHTTPVHSTYASRLHGRRIWHHCTQCDKSPSSSLDHLVRSREPITLFCVPPSRPHDTRARPLASIVIVNHARVTSHDFTSLTRHHFHLVHERPSRQFTPGVPAAQPGRRILACPQLIHVRSDSSRRSRSLSSTPPQTKPRIIHERRAAACRQARAGPRRVALALAAASSHGSLPFPSQAARWGGRHAPGQTHGDNRGRCRPGPTCNAPMERIARRRGRHGGRGVCELVQDRASGGGRRQIPSFRG
jgi:hypothetical protein